MGRALFSQKYLSKPAVCEDPTPPFDVPCQRWSPCNQFDPDSEEFFKNAQLEQFLDGLFDSSVWTLEHSPGDPQNTAALDNVSDSVSSPTTASSNDSDESLSDSNDSPMAIGTDDPASLLDVYVPADFAQDQPRRQSHSTRSTRPSSRRPSSLRHPEGSLISHQTSPTSTSTVLSTAQTHPNAQQAAGSPRSLVVRRTVNITPINIPPSLPTPASPSPPATSTTYPEPATNLIAPFRLRNAQPGYRTWEFHLHL